MSNKVVVTISISVIVLASCLLMARYFYGGPDPLVEKDNIGELAVNYLYNFSTIAELDANMDKLKQITTEQVYAQLTVDNVDRALSTYLKFKNEPSYVKVSKATQNYVSYSLQTKNIASTRKFIFLYETNQKGKISSVREVEAIDFVAAN